MRIASISLHEELRLADLYTYNILDSSSENEFDDLIELTAQIYECPMAAITFIDEKRQWLKANMGVGVSEMPRSISFCTHTILDDQVLIISDATKDDRFFANPLVTDDPSIRFYAGAPIVSAGGYNLGAVCILDQKPRKFSPYQAKALQAISRQVSKLLELRMKNNLLEQWAKKSIGSQNLLLHTTMLKQEKEGLEASTELHENIAQGLVATRFYLEMAEQNPEPFLIKKSRENVSKMIEDTCTLSKKLFPTTLRNTGFADLTTQYTHDYARETGIKIDFLHSGSEKLHADLSLALYRITEEHLKNIRQHAHASKIDIRISVLDTVKLSILDDGIGLDMKDFKRAYGLNKIVSIAEFNGGTVDLNSSLNNGCCLDVCIPFIHKT